MARRVKASRPYRSPRREQQAAATKRTILLVAQRLFEDRGYPTTTMEAIAAEAGVSVKTVYLAFSTKRGLLRALWDLRLKGDQEEAAVAERQWYRDVIEERDPVRKLKLLAHNSVVVKMRISGMLTIIRNAAPLDPDLDALWGLIQSDFHANQQVVVESLRSLKALRRGLTVDRATDILWTLNNPDVWQLLVGERGWSPTQFEKWLADTAIAQLLAPPS